ncbi:MAG TPA: extracellular solute-binding protein, partial [Candidatus Kapabacteria bacterium]|nr:extracellular solute-binding protein [Candidatus Kapabacteria bacterium]
DAIAIVKGTKHEETAKEFYEFVTSKESAVEAANKYFRIPVRSDIDTAQLPEWMHVAIPRMNVDWQDLSAHEKDWMQTWNDHIKTAK